MTTTQKLVAGIDIGGTNTLFGLVDRQGRIIYSESVSTQKSGHPEVLVELVSKKIKDYFRRNKGYVLHGAGIGAPNGNFYKGTVEFAPNLGWKGVVHLAAMFQKGLKVRALVTNDANAAAIGEMTFGGARGMKDFLFITLGTGLGSGIVVNGQMVYGHDGFAGEVGHVIMDIKGRKCGCGRRGCLETYCSATGIKKTYAELNPAINPVKIGAKYIFQKAIEGEEAAIKAFDLTGEMLGLALANSVAYTSPQAIFLFGGLAQAGDLIFKPTIKSFEANVLNIYKNKIRILPSHLNENDAAILGAASLIWNGE